MTTTKTSELTGAALDWAVALAMGMNVVSGVVIAPIPSNGHVVAVEGGDLTDPNGRFSPSTDWSQGGPLIESCGLQIYKAGASILPKSEPAYWASGYGEEMHTGPTPLIAACRAIVAAELGDTVDIPEELLNHE